MAGNTRQEWRFGSYRRQAETARQLIIESRELAIRGHVRGDGEEDLRDWSRVNVYFGVDPCV
ncbi:hypothetical protein F4778DRAFT_727534 [Xylariomycetidae sp. FL2044]|nr:hypothetical protein F4778DRAFT_727534 [Xylariomycetidae sp. FL2044]